MEEVVRLRARSIKADDELHGPVALGDVFESLAEAGIAGGGLGERELRGGRLKVVPEEGSIMAVAGGVDADAEAAWRLRSRSGLSYHEDLGRWGKRETKGP
jgi:hypothetical protein